jgi:hydrogenase maturation protease
MQAGIFGVGNELREDDGIGLVIVEKLKSLFTSDSVDLLVIGDRLFEIPALIINYSKVAIIDALPPDSDPGKIMVFRYDSNNFLIPGTYSLHDLDLLWQLQYAFRSGFKGEILLVGIEVESLAYKEGLSLKLCHSLPSITLIVAKAIKEFLGLTKRVTHPNNLLSI